MTIIAKYPLVTRTACSAVRALLWKQIRCIVPFPLDHPRYRQTVDISVEWLDYAIGDFFSFLYLMFNLIRQLFINFRKPLVRIGSPLGSFTEYTVKCGIRCLTYNGECTLISLSIFM